MASRPLAGAIVCAIAVTIMAAHRDSYAAQPSAGGPATATANAQTPQNGMHQPGGMDHMGPGPSGRSAVDSPGMQRMSEAVTEMARTCQTMMQKEMANRPVKLAALYSGGVLLIVALALLVVLEVQWIRLLSVRIRNERIRSG